MEFPPPPVPPPPPSPPSGPFARGPWLPVAIALVLVVAIGAVLIGSSSRTGQYAFIDTRPDGSPVRWNPCRPIHYVTNLERAPQNEFADIREAVRRVSEATCIRFVYDGPTSAAVALPIEGPDSFYVSGFVAVHDVDAVSPGFAFGPAFGPILQHELGHVVGLAHVLSPSEIMNPEGSLVVTDWGSGDLEGLRLLGREAGCPPAVPAA